MTYKENGMFCFGFLPPLPLSRPVCSYSWVCLQRTGISGNEPLFTYIDTLGNFLRMLLRGHGFTNTIWYFHWLQIGHRMCIPWWPHSNLNSSPYDSVPFLFLSPAYVFTFAPFMCGNRTCHSVVSHRMTTLTPHPWNFAWWANEGLTLGYMHTRLFL